MFSRLSQIRSKQCHVSITQHSICSCVALFILNTHYFRSGITMQTHHHNDLWTQTQPIRESGGMWLPVDCSRRKMFSCFKGLCCRPASLKLFSFEFCSWFCSSLKAFEKPMHPKTCLIWWERDWGGNGTQ